jgi:hypothetical protein
VSILLSLVSLFVCQFSSSADNLLSLVNVCSYQISNIFAVYNVSSSRIAHQTVEEELSKSAKREGSVARETCGRHLHGNRRQMGIRA